MACQTLATAYYEVCIHVHLCLNQQDIIYNDIIIVSFILDLYPSHSCLQITR